MTYVGIALFAVGMITSSIAGVMFIIAAFRVGVFWGLAVLFLPFAQLAFLITHWFEARRAFLLNLAGVAIGFVGVFSMASGTASVATDSNTDLAAEKFTQTMMRTIDSATQPLRNAVFSMKSRSDVYIDPETFLGKPLSEVRRTYGHPKGIASNDGRAELMYEDFTFHSDDGETVSSVSYRVGFEPPEPPPPPEPAEGETPQ